MLGGSCSSVLDAFCAAVIPSSLMIATVGPPPSNYSLNTFIRGTVGI